MKKTLFNLTLLLCLMVSSNHIYAQSFGAKLGTSLSTLRGDDVYGYGDSKTILNPGLIIGGYAKLPMTDAINFSPELMLIQKGMRMADDGASNRSVVNYIEIATNASYAINDQFSVKAGPFLAMQLSSKSVWKFDGEKSVIKGSIDTEYENMADLGLNIGAEYNISELIVVDLRYGLGMVNRVKEASVKNSAIQLSVGYNF